MRQLRSTTGMTPSPIRRIAFVVIVLIMLLACSEQTANSDNPFRAQSTKAPFDDKPNNALVCVRKT